MATEIKAPVFPESVADGTIATWHKKLGKQYHVMKSFVILKLIKLF